MNLRVLTSLILPVAMLLSALSACSILPGSLHAPADPAALYEQSISDAAVASPAKVRPLLPIPATDTVQIVSWVSASNDLCAGADLPCKYTVNNGGMFVTLAGEVQGKCHAWGLSGDALRIRLEQLLGLPPNQAEKYLKSRFVVLETARENLQRPCLGLDVHAGSVQCAMTIPNTPSKEISPLAFVGEQMARDYVTGTSGAPGYPFTRLGYTYDWNPDSVNHYGASELILAQGAVAVVQAQMTTDAYCSK